MNLGISLQTSGPSSNGQFVQSLPAVQQIFAQASAVKPADNVMQVRLFLLRNHLSYEVLYKVYAIYIV